MCRAEKRSVCLSTAAILSVNILLYILWCRCGEFHGTMCFVVPCSASE